MAQKQSTLKHFLSIPSDSESEEASQYTPSPQKGALKLPEMWTRVKSREQMPHQRITVFDIEKDLATDKVLKAVRSGAIREKGEILFDPDEWKGRGDELTIDKCKLTRDELMKYAATATEIRRKLQEKADDIRKKIREEEKVEDEEEDEPQLKRGYLPIQKQSIAKELL